MQEVKDYCSNVYSQIYADEKARLAEAAVSRSRSGGVSNQAMEYIERNAQKEAIKTTLIKGLRAFKDIEAAQIWRVIYEAHVLRKSGIDNAETIANVISADQSWKKSSGHAFEETVKSLTTSVLSEHEIEIILQRDLNILIRENRLHNEPRDISWLREQIRSEVFDLYAIVNRDNKRYCYGVIQSKTSIRDRVTRDREPSMQAMQSFFWSVAITLDGDFLRLPKFRHMVNGGTQEYQHNGWHGMYVFSELYSGGGHFFDAGHHILQEAGAAEVADAGGFERVGGAGFFDGVQRFRAHVFEFIQQSHSISPSQPRIYNMRSGSADRRT